MEENEHKPVEVEEEVRQQGLSREEILAISRKENKNGDERDVQVYRQGMQIACSVAIILVGIITLVRVIMGDNIPTELWIVYMGMMATWTIYYAVKSGKNKVLFICCGVLCSVCFVTFTTLWILGLCGVVV